MEANACGVNRLDSDVLLPPRKRLLACMKKQNGDGNGNSCSPSTSSSLKDLDARLTTLLRPHLSNGNPSQEEIVEASRSAAEVALKIAVAARAVAQEKAVIAAKAMAAAKKALELVGSVEAAETSSSTERQSNTSKMKKHVQVQMLYDNKKQKVENEKASDEELARKLHQAINSSPRISKYGSPSDLKGPKHKRLKISIVSENGKINNGGLVGEGSPPSTSNGNSITHDKVACIGNVDEDMNNINKVDASKMEKRVAERTELKVKFGQEETTSLGRKRGRIKQKKLPLSICHDRDQANPKEDHRSRSSELVEEKTGKATAASSMKPVERNSLWKCKALKAPTCVKQNKAMQS